MKITLPPIDHKPVYTRLLEREVNKAFSEAIYIPLFAMLAQAGVPTKTKFQAIPYDDFGNERANSLDVVAAGLQSGQIHYADGFFSGKFNAAISRQLRAWGATPSDRGGLPGFALEQSKLPLAIRNSIYESKAAAETLHKQMADFLLAAEANAAIAPQSVNVAPEADAILREVNQQFEKGKVKVLPKVEIELGIDTVEVPAQVSEGMRQQLTEELTNNLDLGIKNFVAEQIPELRGLVEANAFAGYRTDRLAKIIEARYGVSKRKAAFLARQESSLLVSKYHETKAKELGCREYVWDTSHDERVRPDHRALNGRTFAYSDPPVCDRASGRRCNPGEDYNCRCVARPVLNFAA